MSAPRLMIDEQQLVAALKHEGWNKSQTACALGVHRQTVARLMKDYDLTPTKPELEPVPELLEEEEEEDNHKALDGQVAPEVDLEILCLPPLGRVDRYILTSAQNNTMVHERMWRSLTHLANHYNAIVMVSRFTYNKGAYKQAQLAKQGTRKASDTEDLWYDPTIEPYVCDKRIRLAPDLEFCGEMNILPTAIRPLSGLENYTKDRSAIFPHAKMAMTTVPSMKFDAPKFNYTTGTCTTRNYIQRKTGLKAQFHHVYGAMLVEVNHEGDWWARQLMSTEDGTIQDLDVVSTPDGTSTNHEIEAIVWGDIHTRALQSREFDTSWGPGGLFDTLAPKYQFLHDILDFRTRTYHDNGKHHIRFRQWCTSQDDVRKEVEDVADFLRDVSHPDCETLVVDSNHDAMFERWFVDGDYKNDPVNAVFFLECQLRKYKAIDEGRPCHLLAELCGEGEDLQRVRFLRPDEGFSVCGIECSLHGHRGPDGSRGSVANLNRLGVRACPAHTHRATIHDGVWSPGVIGALDQHYNVGPSSWSHSNVLIYPTEKRAMITYRNGQWRA